MDLCWAGKNDGFFVQEDEVLGRDNIMLKYTNQTTKLLDTGTIEFTKQDGKTLVCDKRDTAITCTLCRDLHLTPIFYGHLPKDLFTGK